MIAAAASGKATAAVVTVAGSVGVLVGLAAQAIRVGPPRARRIGASPKAFPRALPF